jgi:calcineurin-like phosphoesterase family protein
MQKIKFTGNVWVTSDLHLHHKRIQEFCPLTRKGADVDEMSTMILENIVNTLKPNDTLINLGDFSFGSTDQTYSALQKIQSRGINHHLIVGNHDNNILNNAILSSFFKTINRDATFTFNGNTFVAHHFPKAVWERNHHGSYHIHGHGHGGFSTPGRIMDVGIDTRAAGDMKPYAIEEVVKILENEPFGSHH